MYLTRNTKVPTWVPEFVSRRPPFNHVLSSNLLNIYGELARRYHDMGAGAYEISAQHMAKNEMPIYRCIL